MSVRLSTPYLDELAARLSAASFSLSAASSGALSASERLGSSWEGRGREALSERAEGRVAPALAAASDACSRLSGSLADIAEDAAGLRGLAEGFGDALTGEGAGGRGPSRAVLYADDSGYDYIDARLFSVELGARAVSDAFERVRALASGLRTTTVDIEGLGLDLALRRVEDGARDLREALSRFRSGMAELEAACRAAGAQVAAVFSPRSLASVYSLGAVSDPAAVMWLLSRDPGSLTAAERAIVGGLRERGIGGDGFDMAAYVRWWRSGCDGGTGAAAGAVAALSLFVGAGEAAFVWADLADRAAGEKGLVAALEESGDEGAALVRGAAKLVPGLDFLAAGASVASAAAGGYGEDPWADAARKAANAAMEGAMAGVEAAAELVLPEAAAYAGGVIGGPTGAVVGAVAGTTASFVISVSEDEIEDALFKDDSAPWNGAYRGWMEGLYYLYGGDHGER